MDPTLQASISTLQTGGVIVYPTDTVYGLGADATNADAVSCVRALKGRASEKPILAMVADHSMLAEYAIMTPLADKLAEHFLPGPLALVLTIRDERLRAIADIDGSVGFRIPNNDLCLELAAAFQKPITSTSVNRSGEQQPQEVAAMVRQLDTSVCSVGYVIDRGSIQNSTPSTIVDARGAELVILREGKLSRELLGSVLS